MHKVNPHTKLCFSIIVLCLLNIVTAITLFSNIVNAESTSFTSSTASVTVPEACTMTSHNDTPHTATLTPNTYSGASGSEYENGIGKTTLTTICNDSNGFAIYAIGYTGNSYDSNDHTKLVGSNTGHSINTAVYTNNATPSNWSMKVTKVTNSSESYNPQNMSILDSFDSWHIVPASYTKVAQYHASTGSSVTDATLGAKIETTYAAFIAPNQPADTYVGQVKYTMVHPYDNTTKDGPIADCPANKICYSPNANDIEGTMGQQSIDESTTSTTLLASNFSRKGYGFAGWSDRYDYSNNNGAKFYGPQETISFAAGQYSSTNGGLRLYAIWIPSQGSLQDQSKVANICNSLTAAPTDGTANLDSVSALTDERDNDTYAIAKLADGNCWMIENLRLDNTAAHNSDGSLAQGYGTSAIYGNFSGLANAESGNFSSSTTTNSIYYSGTQSGDATVNIGTSNYPAYRLPRYNNLNTPANANNRPQNPTKNSFTNTNITAGMYSYGNYYTWHAAIADLTYNDTDNSSVTNTSLCPSGWHLPKGGNNQNTANNEFLAFSEALIGAKPASYNSQTYPSYYGIPEGTDASNKLRTYPNNFLYSGLFNTSSADDRGSRGCYWSSTALGSSRSYNLLLVSSVVRPGTTYDGKYNGFSIRCTVSAGT